MFVSRWMWYTFALILVFLVLTRYEAAVALLGSGAKAYYQGVGVLQGRSIDSRGGVGGIAR